MARTDSTNVRSIISVGADVTDLTPFIESASELVTELCADSGYTSTRLELIERWLAAHFIAIRDPRVSSEGAEGLSQSFMYKVGLGLHQTTYGQQAMLMDTAGNLAAMSKRTEKGAPNKAHIRYLGMTREET